MNISFEESSGYLLIKISGEWTEESMRGDIDAAHNAAVKCNVTKLLFDCRNLSNPKSEMLRFYAGKHLSHVLGYPYKIAAIVNKEMYNKFAENVAKNRGANVKVFFQEMPAVEWLLQ